MGHPMTEQTDTSLPGNPTIRPGTSDWAIWKNIVVNNEYRLPDVIPDDANIIDIGAHIGAFSYACLIRGAKFVAAYEPDENNYRLLEKNVNGNINRWQRAVANKTGKVSLTHYPKNGNEINTGGCSIYAQDGETVRMVDCVSLQFILYSMGIGIPMSGLRPPVWLLKLDCEGAEWDILANADLTYIQRIYGEFHEINGHTIDELVGVLNSAGFNKLDWFRHGNSNLGMFFAGREEV